MPRTKRVHVEPGKPWLPVLAMPATWNSNSWGATDLEVRLWRSTKPELNLEFGSKVMKINKSWTEFRIWTRQAWSTTLCDKDTDRISFDNAQNLEFGSKDVQVDKVWTELRIHTRQALLDDDARRQRVHNQRAYIHRISVPRKIVLARSPNQRAGTGLYFEVDTTWQDHY
jgi:hypothetical protein